MNGRKFSITTIVYLFILIDIFLFYYVGFQVLFILCGYQLSLIIGLFLGLRGQGNHKLVMYKLLSLADDPKYNDHEELRGHKLKQQIRYDSLEYDFWYIRHKLKKNVSIKKKTKNFKGGDTKMKEEMTKDLLYLAASIWAASGLMLIDGLWLLNIRPMWIIGLALMFYAGDGIFWLYLWHYWGIKKKDVEPAKIIPQ